MKASYVAPVYHSGTHSSARGCGVVVIGGGGEGVTPVPASRGRDHGAHTRMGVSTAPESDRARQTSILFFLMLPRLVSDLLHI